MTGWTMTRKDILNKMKEQGIRHYILSAVTDWGEDLMKTTCENRIHATDEAFEQTVNRLNKKANGQVYFDVIHNYGSRA